MQTVLLIAVLLFGQLAGALSGDSVLYRDSLSADWTDSSSLSGDETLASAASHFGSGALL
jgi:hypothetical protein